MTLHWWRSRFVWQDRTKEDCPTCGGTGEVWSHNPSCWSCGGSGWRMRNATAAEVRAEVAAGRFFVPDEWAARELARLEAQNNLS